MTNDALDSPIIPDDSRRQDKLRKLQTSQSYPWVSGLLSLLVVGYFLILNQPHLVAFYKLPGIVLRLEFQAAVAGVFFVVAFWDVRRFFRQRRRIEHHITELRREIEDVWCSKKNLQAKAHIYSGHADKLKLFISDKLLEYIEYDEKFLHFKSIAAEVRHNGVISYDKVKTALGKAVEAYAAQAPRPAGEIGDNTPQSVPASNIYQDALEAMRYLWDLLDLSTTDNIALHIGNHLIECEEHYYQSILNKDRDVGSAIKPDFFPEKALVKTLAPLFEPSELQELGALTRKREETGDRALSFVGSQFRLRINHTPTLLGNENHLILLLENLLKNAQFFANKNAFKQKSDRIAVQLQEGQGCVNFSIYNRGPHIDDAEREQIFQLGYSTRRVKEHHGKGLGLFFVNEIVKGYQGRIQIENIQNRENTYSVRIAFKNGEVTTKVVKTFIEDNRPMVQEANGEELVKQLQWEFPDPVLSVEVSSTAWPKTYVFDNLDTKQATHILDPHDCYIPQWAIEVKPKRGAHRVQFNPLDVSGVQFIVQLPTADSRLNGDDLPPEDHLAGEVEKLGEQFKEFDEY